MKNNKWNKIILGMATIVVFLSIKQIIFAKNTGINLQINPGDVISVVFPTVNPSISPFDFVIDPNQLLYKTDEIMYNDGDVEEGATLLFKNHDSEYQFSSVSDKLEVVNQSNIPLQVTITAEIKNLGDIVMSQSDEINNDEICRLYLALVDNKGNEIAITENGQVSITVELQKAPDEAYIYTLNEDGTYEYGLSADLSEIVFDSYSFGLKGNCNKNGTWSSISVNPIIEITWNIEPIYSIYETENDSGYSYESISSNETEIDEISISENEALNDEITVSENESIIDEDEITTSENEIGDNMTEVPENKSEENVTSVSENDG